MFIEIIACFPRDNLVAVTVEKEHGKGRLPQMSSEIDFLKIFELSLSGIRQRRISLKPCSIKDYGQLRFIMRLIFCTDFEFHFFPA